MKGQADRRAAPQGDASGGIGSARMIDSYIFEIQ
jgi:hypothetical protein